MPKARRGGGTRARGRTLVQISAFSVASSARSGPARSRSRTRERKATGLRSSSRHRAGRAWNGAESSRESKAFQSGARSEEHTSELQSRQYLVCRLLLEK